MASINIYANAGPHPPITPKRGKKLSSRQRTLPIPFKSNSTLALSSSFTSSLKQYAEIASLTFALILGITRTILALHFKLLSIKSIVLPAAIEIKSLSPISPSIVFKTEA